MDTSREERRSLLSPADDNSHDVQGHRGFYGASSSTDGNISPVPAAASTSCGIVSDSVPFLQITPGRPVHPHYIADVSTSTLLESGEERFRLMRRALADSRSSRESQPRASAASASSSAKSCVHISWSHVHVHIRKSVSLRSRLGFDSADNEDDTDNGYDGPAPRRSQSRPDEQYEKTILKNVSGSVSPGQLLAIMGASGAGKTTLLNILAGRNAYGLELTGQIQINGEAVEPDFVCSVSGYIQQEDLFISTLTVRETLIFQALLRMPHGNSEAQRLERVEEVLQEVGLLDVAGSTIGDPLRIRGISGGERKRLSFASEVLTDPPLLFVDEPTSGLDSYMAESVVTTLQNLAQAGRTILTTIHQPASEIYTMFDRVMLLAEGRTAFLGPCQEAIEHFRSQGHECPPNFNPADFFVHKLAIVPRKEDECRQRVKSIADAFEERRDLAPEETYKEESRAANLVGRERESWCTQLRVIMKRSWLAFVRDPGLIRVRFIQTIFTALLAGIVYLRMADNQSRVQNAAGIIFFMVTNQVFNPLFSVLQVFPLELPLFLRDVQNRMYATNVYFLSKTLTELPFNIFNAAVYVSITYWMVGLNDELDRFGYAVAMIVLVTLCAISMSYFVSAVSPTIHVAMAIAPMLLMPFLLFGGLFIKVSEIPVFLKWMTHISFINYAFEGLLINEWHNRSVGSDPGEQILYEHGKQVIELYGFEDNMSHAYWDIYKVIMWAAAVRILAYIMLEVRVWRSTHR
ncbi:protein white-like isoform X1 [Sycon ciliatum]|uniref:protein white-like isoform X1 n=1 Tax=Sycon ciliatum TaxID=27933 RepID=UPI0031F60912